MNEFDLSREYAEKIFKDRIFPKITEGITPAVNREAFILGGQPGSGKSAYAREILKSKPNTVFINGDDLRAYHPKYYPYLMGDDKEAADRTQAVSNFWIEESVKECMKRNLNFIIEGTMRKTEVPLKTAKEAKENNYKLNLAVISAPKEPSLLSLDLRYEEVKKKVRFARYTKKESHDEAYHNIENTLQALLDSGLFEKFYICKRSIKGFNECVYDAQEKEEIFKAFNEGRESTIINEKEKELLMLRIRKDLNCEIRKSR